MRADLEMERPRSRPREPHRYTMSVVVDLTHNVAIRICIVDPIPITYASATQPFHRSGAASNLTILDFWAWAYSDCINNTTRGVLAEFLVAAALNLNLKLPRDAWAKFDLTYRSHPLEVKSASYHQRWHQDKLSSINFSVRKTRAWDSDTNRQADTAKRQAFAYVLCLLAEKQRENVDPLDLDQWRFWAISTAFFDDRARSQHSITYNSLCREIGDPVTFSDLRKSVDALIDNNTAV